MNHRSREDPGNAGPNLRSATRVQHQLSLIAQGHANDRVFCGLAGRRKQASFLIDPDVAMNPPKPRHTPDVAEFFRYPAFEGLEIMNARWVKHSFRPHAHDFYAVSLNDRGGGAFHCHGKLCDATPRTCNLIAPGELHTGRATCELGWMYRNLYIEPRLMHTLLEGLDYCGPFSFAFRAAVTRDECLAERLNKVFSSFEAPAALLQRESLLLAVIERLVTNHIIPAHIWRSKGGEHAAVNRVRQWLDAHSEENISIHRLAALANLSPYYLIRVFHRQLGVPPHRYQTMVRINRARTLLLSGKPISEVAYRAGFSDQSHLNRCFKSTLGVTPGQYARPPYTMGTH
jgi:AraC-like DNA-binding protein